MNDATRAQHNFDYLKGHAYPGRLIIQGISEDGKNVLQLYGITARSEPSKNRVLSHVGARLFTEAADPSKPTGNPKLVFYNAMLETGHGFIVSNGSQTDDVVGYHEDIPGCSDLPGSLKDATYEPDEPNNTSRITAACWIEEGKPKFEFSLISKSHTDAPVREFHYHEYPSLPPGFGRGIMTYSDDGNPLPAFVDSPWLLPLHGTVDELLALEQGLTSRYWDALPADKRVALAIKIIDIETGISVIHIKNELTRVPR